MFHTGNWEGLEKTSFGAQIQDINLHRGISIKDIHCEIVTDPKNVI